MRGRSYVRHRRFWTMRCRILGLAAAMACGLSVGPALAQRSDVLVFAAASLKNALDDIGAQYERETGKHATISLAASSARSGNSNRA